MLWVDAAPVDVVQAKEIALTFWNQSGCAVRSGNTSSDFREVASQAGFQNLYIFVKEEGTGFVVMSANDIARPVLGYSESGNFDVANLPSSVAAWLGGYDRAIGEAVAHQVVASAEVSAEWAALANGTLAAPKSTTAVNPLLSTSWDQGSPYNAMCPGSAYNRAPTGCTATAMAQVMKYWSYPSKGMGSHSYTCEYYSQTLSANFGNTTYNWSSMPNAAYSSNTALATLMFHCGVSMEMNYAPDGSGAHLISYNNALEYCAETALKKFFGYNSHLHGERKANYSDEEWIAMLKTDLDAGRPIPYSGVDEVQSVGHAFVFDGYDNNNMFHINWGWSGSSDGYFTINALTPGSTGWGGGGDDYSSSQCAIFGVEPPQLLATSHSSSNMTSSNGGYIVEHGAPLTFTVNIKAPEAFTGSLRLVILKSNGVTVAQQIGSPVNVTLSANQTVTKTFSTSVVTAYPENYLLAVQYQSSGSSEWTTVGISGCAVPADLTVILNPDQYENNNTVATAYVLPVTFSQNQAVVRTTGSNIHSSEDEFDYYKFELPAGYSYRVNARVHDLTSSGNGNSYTADVIFNISYNGSAWIPAVDSIAPEKEMENGGPIVFKVRSKNSSIVGTYLLETEIVRSANSGVNEQSGDQLYTIYPNPVTDVLYCEVNKDKVMDGAVFQILDIFGRIVKQEIVTAGGFVSDVSSLDSGLYFVRFVFDGQIMATKKFVKR